MTNEWIIGLVIACIILTTITATFSVLAFCIVLGEKNSTHRIVTQTKWMDASTGKAVDSEELPDNEDDAFQEEEKGMGFGKTGKDLVDEFKEKVYNDMSDDQV